MAPPCAMRAKAGRLVTQTLPRRLPRPWVRTQSCTSPRHGRRQGESCGNPLDGEGERHHVIAVRDWQGPGSPSQVQNLRIICLLCHRAKTRRGRRARW